MARFGTVAGAVPLSAASASALARMERKISAVLLGFQRRSRGRLRDWRGIATASAARAIRRFFRSRSGGRGSCAGSGAARATGSGCGAAAAAGADTGSGAANTSGPRSGSGSGCSLRRGESDRLRLRRGEHIRPLRSGSGSGSRLRRGESDRLRFRRGESDRLRLRRGEQSGPRSGSGSGSRSGAARVTGSGSGAARATGSGSGAASWAAANRYRPRAEVPSPAPGSSRAAGRPPRAAVHSRCSPTKELRRYPRRLAALPAAAAERGGRLLFSRGGRRSCSGFNSLRRRLIGPCPPETDAAGFELLRGRRPASERKASAESACRAGCGAGAADCPVAWNGGKVTPRMMPRCSRRLSIRATRSTCKVRLPPVRSPRTRVNLLNTIVVTRR